MSKSENSYSQILKSSSIIGGAQGFNYLIGMVRTKMVAVLLGPSGMGLVSLYVSATGLVDTVARLGIDSSGVREVAEAHGSGDEAKIARTVKTLRRMCWLTGIFGWLLTAALSYPLSVWTFGSGERAWAIAILGVTILIGSVSGGQSSIIQGTRRIGDLARMNVLGAVAGTLIAIGLYAWLGQGGIVPVIIATATTNLGFSFWFARQIPVADASLTWLETIRNSKRLVHLGIAFMYGALLFSLVGVAIRAVIVKKLGLDAAGIYQAAWGISGMFAGFIINAMGTDFYPRLTAVADDNEKVNRMVNDQTEIGILLALPGLIGTLAFAPWIMKLMYSSRFISGSEILPWLVLGVYGQIIIFPIGYIQRAKASRRWIYIGQTEANLTLLIFSLVAIYFIGLVGLGYAYVCHIIIHGLVVYWIAYRLSKFHWRKETCMLFAVSWGLILITFSLHFIKVDTIVLGVGLLLFTVGSLISLRGIASRVGTKNKIVSMLCKHKIGQILCGLKNIS
jgi:PST family polysaccharide transporter